jgi:hypothetical protein
MVSVLPLIGTGDGTSWWSGGSVTIPGAPDGITAALECHGSKLATAAVKNKSAKFFGNDPLIPIGYVDGIYIRVEYPGLECPATAPIANGPDLIAQAEANEQDADKPAIICVVPVTVLDQGWMPSRLSRRSKLLGANNQLLIDTNNTMEIRWMR